MCLQLDQLQASLVSESSAARLHLFLKSRRQRYPLLQKGVERKRRTFRLHIICTGPPSLQLVMVCNDLGEVSASA